MSSTLTVKTEKQTLGERSALVILNMSLPRIEERSPTSFGKRFNNYYGGIGTGFAHFAHGTLLRSAERNEGKEGFSPYGAVLKTVICRETDRVLSLYIDAALSTDSRRIHRFSQLWDKERATLTGFDGLFTKKAKHSLFPILYANAVSRSESAGVPLFADSQAQIKKLFRKEQLYLSPQGVVFFYQGNEISNRAEPFPVHIATGEAEPYLTELGRAVLL